jgi:hypothetical protein
MRRQSRKSVVTSDIFPRFHTHVSWRQRWHYGTGKTGVLNKHEQPLRGVQVDHSQAHQRVTVFRVAFHKAMQQIAVALQQYRLILKEKKNE